MVKQSEVYAVADKLRAGGKRVTLTAVRGKLREGGSNRDICPLLRDWKRDRVYKPRLELADMPAEVKEKFEAFSIAAWQVLKDRASADLSEALGDKKLFDDEMAVVADLRADEIAALREALRAKDEALRSLETALKARWDARAERAAAEALAKRNRELEEEVERLRGLVGGAPRADGAADAAR